MSLRPAYFIGMVSYYECHINEIVEKYCVNKEVPELKCNGQCHLAKQLASVNNVENDNESVIDISLAFYPVFYQKILDDNTPLLVAYKHKDEFYHLLNYDYSSLNTLLKPPVV
ncbi:hypothetical protein [Wenyingzhuangia sp. IMCC45574]